MGAERKAEQAIQMVSAYGMGMAGLSWGRLTRPGHILDYLGEGGRHLVQKG